MITLRPNRTLHGSPSVGSILIRELTFCALRPFSVGHHPERGSRREWSNATNTAATFLVESCSSSFRLLIHGRLRRSRLDIGQIKLGEVERQLVANLDGTGLIVPTGVWTIAAPHF
jgi:hypothetical protein